jgi:hypothetical protein
MATDPSSSPARQTGMIVPAVSRGGAPRRWCAGQSPHVKVPIQVVHRDAGTKGKLMGVTIPRMKMPVPQVTASYGQQSLLRNPEATSHKIYATRLGTPSMSHGEGSWRIWVHPTVLPEVPPAAATSTTHHGVRTPHQREIPRDTAHRHTYRPTGDVRRVSSILHGPCLNLEKWCRARSTVAALPQSLSTLCQHDGGSHKHPMAVRAGLIGSNEVRAEQQRDQRRISRVLVLIAYDDFGVPVSRVAHGEDNPGSLVPHARATGREEPGGDWSDAEVPHAIHTKKKGRPEWAVTRVHWWVAQRGEDGPRGEVWRDRKWPKPIFVSFLLFFYLCFLF